jgi:hypothetical protein
MPKSFEIRRGGASLRVSIYDLFPRAASCLAEFPQALLPGIKRQSRARHAVSVTRWACSATFLHAPALPGSMAALARPGPFLGITSISCPTSFLSPHVVRVCTCCQIRWVVSSLDSRGRSVLGRSACCGRLFFRDASRASGLCFDWAAAGDLVWRRSALGGGDRCAFTDRERA